MNLIKLFTREELIAGLEVSDKLLRFVLLEFDKKDSKIAAKFIVEEDLPKGSIENGVIVNQADFVRTLQILIKRSKSKIRYVIASLPTDNIYLKIFSFPKNVREEKLEEAMKLTIGFQLPVKPEEVYLDWERVEGPDQNEILLAALKKSIVDQYIQALHLAGLRPVAVEFHPLSFLRVINLEQNEIALIKLMQSTSTELFVIKNKTIRFNRVLPKDLFPEEKIEGEIKKISNFYESENAPVTKTLDLEEAKLTPNLEHLKEKMEGKAGRWLISIGAAMRGLLPRSKDAAISLLPVGTQEAYEYQKATVFAEFISSVIIGLALFFSVGFLAAWGLLLSFKQAALNRLETLNALPIPVDAGELRNKAAMLNNIVRVEAEIIKNIPAWSRVIHEIRVRTTPGVAVNSLGTVSPEAEIRITGTSSDRPQLNAFRENLQGSELFTDINMPLTSLEQKANIPFSVTFRLKNPREIYLIP